MWKPPPTLMMMMMLLLLMMMMANAAATQQQQQQQPSLGAAGPPFAPSDPKATAEARALLQYLYSITGHHTVTGSNTDGLWPNSAWANITRITGKSPGLYGGQFLWGNWDNLRDEMVNDILKTYNGPNGTHVIPAINFHLCPPMPEFVNENCTWHDINQARPPALIDSILTNGSAANLQWLAAVDHFALWLLRLQSANVPVLWRPFHEMNGAWFWWGAQARFKELWLQLYARLTDHHGLHNLLWVFAPNGPHGNILQPDAFYPGDEYVDILGEDVYVEYGDSFSDTHYEQLLRLGSGRPIALCEVGRAPTADLLRQQQPKYAYFMIWNHFESNPQDNPPQDLQRLFNDPWVLNQGDIKF